MASSKWPTWKWVVLLYISTDHAWHCDALCIRLSFKYTELFDIYILLLCTWPLFQNESDCPSYPTERYTVDIDGVQVADLTADAVQSLAISQSNGSVTLFLPLLNQPLPENAVTLNMTKYNTVPTNRSDVTGNIVTEMVTWGTSAVFGELTLVTREINILYRVLQLFMHVHTYILHYWIFYLI